MTNAATALLDCRGIEKSFAAVQALRGVDFAVRPGRVHGLVGENGAGKSTLTKVLAGLYPPDAGTISLDGRPLELRGTDDALARGIVTVHQDINLIPTQTVAENIFLANEFTTGPLGIVRMGAMRAKARELLARYGIAVSPDSRVAELTNDQRKMVQIVKAISRRARVLLLDEPTSSLTEDEVRLVLRLIRDLAAQGTGIVFISHYLSEVFEICDEITVLRDGAVVLAELISNTSLPSVVAAMIGRRLEAATRRTESTRSAEPLLEVCELSVRNGPRQASFTLHKGEILGITGLTGSGLTELAKAIFASPDTRREGGSVRLDGQELSLRDPSDALAAGIVLLTNDRLREGVLPDFTIQENVVLPVLGRFAGVLGRLDLAAIGTVAREAIGRLRVRAPGPQTPVRSLSGGNQQKVLFAKWLGTKPRVFIMDEPTIGIDVGSKAEIRELIRAIAADGVGVVLITAEIDELTTLCDRVLVMFRGKFVAELENDAIERSAILHASVSGRLAA
ncbi:MAG: sugar ABC transporter ATP-binding protein [Geminicoccaceae bacterium]